MFVKTKDQVVVISGKDKGAKGKVVTAAPKTGKIVVEGVAMMTKHQKPRRHRQEGSLHRCQQRDGDLPQVRQGHPHCP